MGRTATIGGGKKHHFVVVAFVAKQGARPMIFDGKEKAQKFLVTLAIILTSTYKNTCIFKTS
jgi:hypothetical protein